MARQRRQPQQPQPPASPAVQAIQQRQLAWQKVSDQLNRQQQTLVDINAQIYRSAQIYKTNLEVQQKRRDLQEEMRKQAEAQGILAEKAATAEDRRLAALRSLNQGAERREQMLVSIGVQIDRAAQTYAGDLKVQEQRLRLQEEMKRQAEAQGVLVEKAVTAEDRRLTALRSINQEMDTQRQRLAYLQEASTPERLQEQASLGKQVEEAQRQYRRKLRTARGEGGGLADVGDFLGEHGLPGGKLLGSLQGGLNKLAPGLAKGLDGLLGDVGPKLATLAPVAAGVGVALTAAKLGFDLVKSAVDRFVATTVRLGSLASPGAGKRYEIAHQDVQAVIGQRLVPVLEIFTQGLRLAGDFLHTILPSAREVRQALAPLGDALRDVRSALAPIAYELKGELRSALSVVAVSLREAALALKLFTLSIPRLSGAPRLESSVGAAPRQASFGGVDDYAKRIYAGAYSSAGPGDAAKQTATNTSRMVDILGQIKDRMQQGSAGGPAGTVAGAVVGAVQTWIMGR